MQVTHTIYTVLTPLYQIIRPPHQITISRNINYACFTPLLQGEWRVLNSYGLLVFWPPNCGAVTYRPCPLALSAATDVSLQGTFLADDSLRSFWVKITTPSTVTMKTLSYAGGENSLGETVEGGGFAPVLTLFSGLNDP